MNHLIQSQQIELSLQGDEKDAFGLQERMSSFFQIEMLPQMNQIFDQFAGEDQQIQIERLEVDLGVLSETALFSALGLDRLAERLAEVLKSYQEVELAQSKAPSTPADRLWHAWLYFMEHASLPWYIKQLPQEFEAEIFERLASKPQAREQLKDLVRAHTIALTRLVKQSSDQFLANLLTLYAPKLRSKAQVLWSILEKALPTQLKAASQQSKALSLERIKQAYWQHQSLQIIEVLSLAQWEQESIAWVEAKLPILPPRIWEEITTVLPQARPQRPPQKPVESAETESISPPATDLAAENILETAPEGAGEAFHEVGPQQESQVEKKAKEAQQPEYSSTENKAETIAQDQPEQPKEETTEELRSTKAEKPTDEAWEVPLEDMATKIAEAISNSQEFGREAETESTPSSEDKRADLLDAPAPIQAPKAYALKEQSHYINNAGVIIAHAYLSSFWQKLDWVKEGDFVDLDMQERAALSLHYLARGERQAPEYELLLPKILCGLPLNHPLSAGQALSKAETEEAENLLQAIIRNWGALGEVSNDSLREGFLHRPGKLELKSGKWRLQIERQTIDILLDRLPWSFSIVKLPWMSDPLMVDWN
ncbi:MAG: contractile injection system tape measure protein [Bacteroidota bacterium]